MLYKPSELKAFLADIGAAPKRQLSQNFLIDGNIIRKDGTTIMLEDNECINYEGNKVKFKAKDKKEKEEEMHPPLLYK